MAVRTKTYDKSLEKHDRIARKATRKFLRDIFGDRILSIDETSKEKGPDFNVFDIVAKIRSKSGSKIIEMCIETSQKLVWLDHPDVGVYRYFSRKNQEFVETDLAQIEARKKDKKIYDRKATHFSLFNEPCDWMMLMKGEAVFEGNERIIECYNTAESVMVCVPLSKIIFFKKINGKWQKDTDIVKPDFVNVKSKKLKKSK